MLELNFLIISELPVLSQERLSIPQGTVETWVELQHVD